MKKMKNTGSKVGSGNTPAYVLFKSSSTLQQFSVHNLEKCLFDLEKKSVEYFPNGTEYFPNEYWEK